MADQTTETLAERARAAQTALEAGRLDEARALCQEIFNVEPGHLGALTTYVTATQITAADPVLTRLRNAAQAPLPDPLQSRVQFLLGKALDDIGDKPAAFAAFVQANALKGATFDVAASRRTAARLVKAVAALDIAPLPPAPPRMIFVLGMPRSGTSLMAQCLGRHPDILTLGEQTGLGRALSGPNGPLEVLSALTPETLSAARASYLESLPPEALTRATTDGARLLDKMPENYWFAGLIPHLFPDALILHMTREKRATCWSCFRNDFLTGHAYSYDFENTLAHYETQAALCRAWATQSPTHWTTVALEDLARAPKDTLEPILETLGLPWHPACLTPEAGEGPVRTLSKAQVRAGISPEISAGWKAYAPLIREKWKIDG